MRHDAPLATVAAPAVSKASARNNAAAPVGGVLKLPDAPAESVHEPAAVGAAFDNWTTNVIALLSELAGDASVTVADVPEAPLLVAVLATIACSAVPETSAPVTSNSISKSPVPLPLVTVATGAAEVGLAPALPTQAES